MLYLTSYLNYVCMYVYMYVCMYVCMYVLGCNVTLQDIINSKRTVMLSCCLFCVFYTASESLTLLTSEEDFGKESKCRVKF